jgi:hypothetical protein
MQNRILGIVLASALLCAALLCAIPCRAAGGAVVTDGNGAEVGAYFLVPLPINPRIMPPTLNTNTQDLALVNVPIAAKTDLLFLLPIGSIGFEPVGAPGVAVLGPLLYYLAPGCTGTAYMTPLAWNRTAVAGTYEVADGTLYFGTPEVGKELTAESSRVIGPDGTPQACLVEDFKTPLSPMETIDLSVLGFTLPFRVSE